jgi:His/Glu/Gln/Arg/opine family amino acid ABC transporter permease subunit
MLETFNFRVIINTLPQFLQGLAGTTWICLIALLGAMLVGIVACVMRLSNRSMVSTPAVMYIELIRSTPLLAQIYFFYFGLPSLGFRISETFTGIIALSLNSGAYVAEIIRAGVMSVPKGQTEAATASGLSYYQQLRYIVLPQAIGISIPALLGQMIVLVKDSALLALISVFELTRAGQLLASDRFMPAEGFFTTAFFYLLIYMVLKFAAIQWQKRLIFQPGT